MQAAPGGGAPQLLSVNLHLAALLHPAAAARVGGAASVCPAVAGGPAAMWQPVVTATRMMCLPDLRILNVLHSIL